MEFYYSDQAGGGDESIESLGERIAIAGALSEADRLAVARGLYQRLMDQGQIFGDWPEATGGDQLGGEAPLEPEWDDG
jgi:hypothetical protein